MTIQALPTESESPRPPAATASVRAPGAITLARHGRPALSRKVLLTSQGYRDWWATYEVGGLCKKQTPPPGLVETAARADAIFVSTRTRAIETAGHVAGERDLNINPVFIEAPLPPPAFPAWVKLSPRWWGVVSRIWWWAFDFHDEGEESRDLARARAVKAADLLIARAEQGEEVLVLAHGFFNAMIGHRLKRLGWRCTRDQGFRYWSTRRFEKR
jgi:broad specificity phosphatase PhoE